MSVRKPNFCAAIVDRLDADSGARDYSLYQGDPVGFGRDVLGHDYPPDVIALFLSVVENRVTQGISDNATGKSYGIGDLAVWHYCVYEDSQTFLAAAPPESNLDAILWPKVVQNTINHPELFVGAKITTEGIVDLKNPNHFVRRVTIPASANQAQAEARISGRHAQHFLVCVDEADGVPDSFFNGIETCMSGDHDRLLCTFNPRQSSGRMYQMERGGQSKVVRLRAFNHPNVVTGRNVFPGAVSREVTVYRINAFSRPLAPDESLNSNCFEVPEFLVGCTAKNPNNTDEIYPPIAPGWRYVTNQQLWHMTLCQYPAQSSQQLISREWVVAAQMRWERHVLEHGERPLLGEHGVAGNDLAEFGGDKSVILARYPSGFVTRPKKWSGMDPTDSAIIATNWCNDRLLLSCSVDAIGIGSGSNTLMIRIGCKCCVYGVKFDKLPIAGLYCNPLDQVDFKTIKDQLYWLVREWLRTDPNAMLPPDQELEEELLAVEYSYKKGKIVVTDKDELRKRLKRSPDVMESLVLTFYEPESAYPELDFS